MAQNELKPCPFCGEQVRLIHTQGGYAIICEGRNCLGMMSIKYGSCDNKMVFKEKLISDWNSRKPEVIAVTAAVECIEDYRNTLYEEKQEPYDEHGCCCISVLDEALNRLRCFTASAVVEAWNRRVDHGKVD